jgi:hypothetical protein
VVTVPPRCEVKPQSLLLYVNWLAQAAMAQWVIVKGFPLWAVEVQMVFWVLGPLALVVVLPLEVQERQAMLQAPWLVYPLERPQEPL